MDHSDGDEIYSEDEESYQNLIRARAGVIEDTVIDESIDGSSSEPQARNEGSARLSESFQFRKKPMRRLVSDSSDSDDVIDNTPDIISNAVLHTLSATSQVPRESSDESSNLESVSILTGQRKSRVIQTDSDDVDYPKRTINKSSEIIDTDSDDGLSKWTAKSTRIVGLESSNRTESVQVIDSFANRSRQNSNPARSSDIFSNNSRISNQFRLNSEGILSSTTVHQTAEKQPQGMWRPSNVSDSVEVLSDDSDIIEVSSDGGIITPLQSPLKFLRPKESVQQTLHAFIETGSPAPTPKQQTPVKQPKQQTPVNQRSTPRPLINRQQNTDSSKNIVSRAAYQAQLAKVNTLEVDLVKLQSLAESLDFEALPDKGRLVTERVRVTEKKYVEEKRKLNEMEASDDIKDENDSQAQGACANVAWEDIQEGANAVLPKTFGKRAMNTYNTQKAVTLDRLQQLHGALQTCPKEEDLEEDPKGLVIPLMPHQRRALAWLMFREKERPSGGILADDMGLGKTLTMISLIIKSLALEKRDDSDEENRDRGEFIGKRTKYDGGSLIVCPASLINQWSGEIDNRLKRGLISYNLYHGPKRETKPKRLSKYDMVITTYAIVNNECDKDGSPLFRIRWRRIILDEAHQIRNFKAQTSEACCQLFGRSRWSLTGTPMHNKEMDMYAQLKFLRCTPFDDIQVWKRWVGDKGHGGTERLHTVISSLMLRRTKVELMEKGTLNCMPEKKWLLVRVELDKNELEVYHKVLIFSRTLFAQFLHQRAEKNQDYIDFKFTDNAPNQEYNKMREKLLRLNKVKNVSQHEILVLLLRLRQICCHPSLITAMLDEGLGDVGAGDDELEQLNLLDQLDKLNIEDEQQGEEDEYKPTNDVASGLATAEKVNLKEAARGHLRASDPVFSKERASSKIKQMLKVLQQEVLSKRDKAIIVSQWPSYLTLIGMHLGENDVEFDQLDGSVPVNKRMDIVNTFNNPQSPVKVLLLSLTAGGVGLNLIGANHLFLLDLHWNPQLENQAQDRIYRVGQKKPVFVYKFMAADTIEERIKLLQDKKLAMAEGILTGTSQVVQSKLSLQDLRMIFGM